MSSPVRASGEPQKVDNGNIYIFCDTVQTGGAESLACVRGAGHNGEHLFSRIVPLIPVTLASASASDDGAARPQPALQRIRAEQEQVAAGCTSGSDPRYQAAIAIIASIDEATAALSSPSVADKPSTTRT